MNLSQPIQMQLSNKLKNISDVLTAFPKSTFNFECLEKKHKPHSLCICEVIDGEKCAYVNVSKVRF